MLGPFIAGPCPDSLSFSPYFFTYFSFLTGASYTVVKGIVSPDWKGLQMVSLDRFEV
jgi:hypothetical protein